MEKVKVDLINFALPPLRKTEKKHEIINFIFW